MILPQGIYSPIKYLGFLFLVFDYYDSHCHGHSYTRLFMDISFHLSLRNTYKKICSVIVELY